MEIVPKIQAAVAAFLKNNYQEEVAFDAVVVSPTKREFAGDFTVVLFPFVKALRTNPAQLGEAIGNQLISQTWVTAFEVKGGFLNLTLANSIWKELLDTVTVSDRQRDPEPKIIIEYSSPNTNKPLHLGHIRNILLGWSCVQIYKAIGYQVIKTQVINDRGIAICKSMLAWKKFGNKKTPASTRTKGDHFVGEYYVLFNTKLDEEYKSWQQQTEAQGIYVANRKEDQNEAAFFKAYANTYFNEHSLLGRESKEMLLKWEAGDPETIELWQMMNNWVYDGFNATYTELGVDFDTIYYESETYLLGKESVDIGLAKDIFYRNDDGSVWIDLEDAGMDKKILLRSDGTSVYITQDIGTAQHRYQDFHFDRMVYVVGDEQEYHFKVLFEILKRLGEPYADQLFHLAYGMVDLPTGKMKSREGTVVDADDLITEILGEARKAAEERGELADLAPQEQEKIIRNIALGALKFFILKVNAKKRMVFNPEESLDLQGQTGPYVQNAYVRIRSILRKADQMTIPQDYSGYQLVPEERELISLLLQYWETLVQAANNFDPSGVANYAYQMAKSFHRYYHDVSILRAESEEAMAFRFVLIRKIAKVLQHAMLMLGIEMPDRM
ncbi:MAG: arginine--tRNA ligase [Saprospiraceae bacterium]|nr:arginine--tRNA ligase [Saprospiraceae bacterium]MCB9318620.1 arginine--tRNA ligase [Lewinellaceae bacterium]